MVMSVLLVVISVLLVVISAFLVVISALLVVISAISIVVGCTFHTNCYTFPCRRRSLRSAGMGYVQAPNYVGPYFR